MYNPIRKYQQGGQADPEQLMQQIAQMLQQQIPPQQIMQQLQKMGIQPEQAQQMIQQVAQSMQQEAPQQEQPQMQQGGYNSVADYSKASGRDSSFSGRKQIAASLGISNYTGTAQQNQMLMQKLQEQDSQNRNFQRQDAVTNPETGLEENYNTNNVEELNIVKQQRLQAIKDHYNKLQKQGSQKVIPIHNPKKPEEIAYYPTSDERLKAMEQQSIEQNFNPLGLNYKNAAPTQTEHGLNPKYTKEPDFNYEGLKNIGIGTGITGAVLGSGVAGVYGLNKVQNFLEKSPEYVKQLQKTKEYKDANKILMSTPTNPYVNLAQQNAAQAERLGQFGLPKKALAILAKQNKMNDLLELAGDESQMLVSQAPQMGKLKQGWNAAKEVLAGSKFLKNAKNLLRFEEGGEFDVDDYNPYLSEENNMMMKNSMMQQGGKINYADFPPERTIIKREELYKGANPNILVYQDTYGDGRKDITYQDRKTGRMMSNPWATNKDSSINRSVTGSLDLQNPKFTPIQSVSKMKKGGMKKWSY